MPRTKRRFTEEFRLGVVQEVLAGESQAAVARRHSVSANSILEWTKAYRAGSLGGEGTGGPDVQRLLVQTRADEAHIAELQRIVGQKEDEITFLKRTARLKEQQTAAAALRKIGAGSRSGKGAR
ncbi:transposase [candidate division KSB1 bacterium]|nr:transposase [candidate division KSB1 bacterium]